MSALRLKSFLLLSGLVWLVAASARADLAFVLAPSVPSGVGTNEIIFTGTLTNTSPTDELFLNNIQFNFMNGAGNYLAADTNVFFANVPGILLPGETYADVVFGIIITPGTPPGQYFGSVTVQGGTNIFAADSLAGPLFEVSLAPAALDVALSGTNVVLSWPSPPGDFVLQQNSDLTTANWQTVTNVPAFSNFQEQVMLPVGAGNSFYRLEYP